MVQMSLPVLEKYLPVFDQYNLEPVVPEVTERLEEDDQTSALEQAAAEESVAQDAAPSAS